MALGPNGEAPLGGGFAGCAGACGHGAGAGDCINGANDGARRCGSAIDGPAFPGMLMGVGGAPSGGAATGSAKAAADKVSSTKIRIPRTTIATCSIA